ncbi:MAG: CpsD/CapB family tyrosine-protein kinase [Planctomycetaceae bacterium]|nr:CpsD/CapB family tyrosine-protein kinase [Planctomycetaceae bacterium]
MPETEANNILERSEQPSSVRVALKGDAQEIFHSLWASLFFSGRSVGKSVMVCSIGQQEGATTVASALALAGSVPAGNERVALVDLNFRSPALHEVMGLEQNLGVSEMVLDGVAPEIAAQSVTPGLDVFAAGGGSQRFLEILRSDALRGVLASLAAKYDRVVVDVPAANAYPDAQMVAAIVKDVVLVVRADQTPREAVAMAKKRIEGAGGRVAGVILNMRMYPIPKFLYNRV